MRHRKAKITLSRTAAERRALVRKLTIALLMHGKIRTTAPRARFVRRFAEPLITHAKPGTLQARRYVIAALGNRRAAEGALARGKQYATRPGGYTRVTRLPNRRSGDGAHIVLLEFV